MATISNNTIAQAIYIALKDKKVGEQSTILKQVVQFLARKRLLSKAPDILARLSKIINEDEGKILVKVSSIEKMSEATKKEISHGLAKRYGDRTIILEEHIDDKLLGGYKVEVSDEVLDLSIKNRMAKLQEHLIKSA